MGGQLGTLLQYRHLLDVPATRFCWCRSCGGRFSAARRDYWFMPDDAIVTCNACDAPMVLAREDRRVVILAGR